MIRFNAEVVRVEAKGERWRVLWRLHPLPPVSGSAYENPQSKMSVESVVEELFDAVMVCCGNHTTPSVPVLNGEPHVLNKICECYSLRLDRLCLGLGITLQSQN